MKKVYIMTKFDMQNCSKEIYKVLSVKDKAKQIVDVLNNEFNDDNSVFYTLDSYDVEGDENDY